MVVVLMKVTQNGNDIWAASFFVKNSDIIIATKKMFNNRFWSLAVINFQTFESHTKIVKTCICVWIFETDFSNLFITTNLLLYFKRLFAFLVLSKYANNEKVTKVKVKIFETETTKSTTIITLQLNQDYYFAWRH